MEVIKIAFVGDICPGGVLNGSSSKCISEEVYEYLKIFDIRVGTLESAIGNNFSFDEDKMKKRSNIIFSKDEDIRRIKEIGINIVSLANNHVTDLGPDGLINTIKLLDLNGILHFGAGRNIGEAETPIILKIKDKKIAFIGFYDTTIAPHPASEYLPGVCTSNNLINNIIRSKQLYDYVFVLPHWGFEHIYRPLPRDKKLGYQIIRAGADGVIGSHTHQIQPYIIYKGKPIFFSLGNFLFPDFYQQPPCPIWYPDIPEEINNIPSVQRYLSNIIKPVKHVWRHESRIGIIAEIHVSDKIEVKYKLTYLDKNNRITFLNNGMRYIMILSTLGFIVRFPFYDISFFIMECYLYLRRRIKIIFKLNLLLSKISFLKTFVSNNKINT